MSTDLDSKAEAILDELAAKSDPKDTSKLDQQFTAKLDRLVADGHHKEMAKQLKLLWSMLRADDEIVSFKAKTMIMAALSYWIAPFDAIPDFAGKAGMIDDAAIVRLVCRRVSKDIDKFQAWVAGD
jgi:uncharacterized membrane protein YkvA (DUF1232 family)